jgi:hypothetical protein
MKNFSLVFRFSLLSFLMVLFFWLIRRAEAETIKYDSAPSPAGYSPDISIGAHQSHLESLEQTAGQQALDIFLINVNEIAGIIKDQFPLIFGYEILKILSAAAKPKRIVLTPSSIFPSHESLGVGHEKSLGRYTQRTIFLSVPETSSDMILYRNNIISTIRNEVYHFVCAEANYQKFGRYSIIPFLNKRGDVDHLLYDKFVYALREVQANVVRLEKLYTQPKDTLTVAEVLTLKHYESLLENYVPDIRRLAENSTEILQEVLNSSTKNIDGKTVIPKGTMINTKKVYFDYLVVGMHIDKDKTYIFFQYYSPTKLGVFLKDFTGAFRTIYSSAVYNQNDHTQLAELGSTFASFPDDLLQNIAPRFCEYMSQYLNLKGNFCALPAAPSSLGYKMEL